MGQSDAPAEVRLSEGLGPLLEKKNVDKQQWQAFIADKRARKAAEAKWLEQHAKLVEAERLLFDERWTTDDPWPGVLYRGPTGDGIKVVDVETWTLIRALVRGMGEASLRMDRRKEA